MAQAQREMAAAAKNNSGAATAADSGEDEAPPVREKPQRPPPNRRKKSKEALVEEDIIDGFAILGFKSYDDLEVPYYSISVLSLLSVCVSVRLNI